MFSRGQLCGLGNGRGVVTMGDSALKVLTKIDTKEDDVYCICPDNNSLGIASGHNSKVKGWSKDNGSLSYEILLPIRGEVTSLLTTPTQLAVSVDSSLLLYDPRNLATPTETCQYNLDEINQIVSDSSGNYLLSCDDSGSISVIDTSARGKSKLYKKCRRQHANICSTVAFHPTKHWEMISGGLDCQLILWDYSRGRKLSSLNMQEEGGSSAGYMVNPPMVHSLCSLGGKKPLIAAGLGNGCICVCHVGGSDIRLLSSVQPHTNSVANVTCISNEESFHLPAAATSDLATGGEEEEGTCTDIVISGGNDRKIICSPVLKTTPQATPTTKPNTSSHKLKGASHKTPPTYRLAEKPLSVTTHGSKVNWLTGLPNWTPGRHVVGVADQTSHITLYLFEL